MFKTKKKIIAVYCIENICNKYKYIGGTQDYKKRISKHKSLLNLGLHPNEILQYDWSYLSKLNFSFYILEECSQNNLDFIEQQYIEKYQTLYPNGYNLKEAGKNGKYTLYMKNRISEARIGNKNAKGLKGFKRSHINKIKFHLYQSGRKRIKKLHVKA